MKEHALLVHQTIHRAKRKPQRKKPGTTSPRQIWRIDMTRFMVDSMGLVYLVIVPGRYTKKIAGQDISLRSRACEWKRALDMALNREFPHGVCGRGLNLVSDNSFWPTSRAFMSDMANPGIQQIFTYYNDPRGNADTEQMIRAIKEEVIWLNEFDSLAKAKEEIGNWIEGDYNRLYIHSASCYRSP